MKMDASVSLLAARGITKTYTQKAGLIEELSQLAGSEATPQVVRAVDGVDFIVRPGDVLGLVGESGCGKSTIGRMVAGVMEPTAGSVLLNEKDLYKECMTRERLAIQLVFQDPFASLNPRMTVGKIIGEAARYHGLVTRAECDDYVEAIMAKVGLDPSYKSRYPHQFSGGQRQRVGIARALAVQPSVLVCDEAVSALDVSIQAQILTLFLDLRESLHLTYLFISHDLGVVNHIANRILVMYLGRVVEAGETEDILRLPNHPYTRGLLDDVPRIGERKRRFHPIPGELPSPLRPPSGCHFHPRCPHAMPVCKKVSPELRPVGSGRLSACHLNGLP